MNAKICLGANTHQLIKAGGHVWFYLNWALGLKALGCRVVWLEQVDLETPAEQLGSTIKELKNALAPFGLQDSLALCSKNGEQLPPEVANGCMDVEAALDADLLLNVGGKIASRTVARFRRSVFVDIDPGLTQIWIHEGKQPIAPHDLYFSIGETVGTSRATFPDCGVSWIYTPHPICLPEWKPAYAGKTAPYTTVTSWWGWWEEYQGESFNNEKRTTFLDYLDLPQHISARLELALALWGHNDHEDVRLLQDHGWEVKAAFDISGTPEDYRQYLSNSRGEFSCAKPSCMRLANAWISDRTLCYMAMGKPAIVQYCGSSRRLSEAEGLFRFRDINEAVRAIETAEADYEYYGRQARAFVEEYFEATKVVGALLERALA